MSHNPLDWSDGIPDCIIFASTADAERGAAMYRSMADALDAKDARIKELERALRKLVTECEAEFTLDGEWVDFEPLVKPSTINRARKALK